MKVLILTDSLSLPRTKPEQVDYYQTWPRLLEKKMPGEYVSIGIGGGTSTEIVNQATIYYIAPIRNHQHDTHTDNPELHQLATNIHKQP